MNASAMRRLRLYHRYLGLFFAPAILFFAVTGAVQTLGFQDRTAGYVPPRWVAVLAGVHKHQAIPMPKPAEREAAAMPTAPAKTPAAVSMKSHSPWPLKIFVLLLSIGLTLASSLGIIIALVPRSTRGRSILLLGLGTVTPVLLLLV